MSAAHVSRSATQARTGTYVVELREIKPSSIENRSEGDDSEANYERYHGARMVGRDGVIRWYFGQRRG